jgi:hypothetical protein
MSKRNYQRGPDRPGGGASEVRDAQDEEEAYFALKRIQERARREDQEKREVEKRDSIVTPELKLSRAIKRTFAYNELAEAFGGLLADAWQTNDPRLAERFSEAMKKACAEYPDNISMAMHTAWESDPELRGHFSKAVSAGLRKMWADPAARRLQGDLIKQTYKHGDLRERRSEHFKKLWTDSDTRKTMLAAAKQKSKSKEFAEVISAAQKRNWDNPVKHARRLARIKATKATRPPQPSRACLSCGQMFVPKRSSKFCSDSCWRLFRYGSSKTSPRRHPANDNNVVIAHCATCGGYAAFPYKGKWYCDACIDNADKAA